MGNFADFQEANATFADEFAKTDAGTKPLPPARKALLITCMDARIHPEKALGVDIGDIHVVRNAGGSSLEALRSVTISQQLLGTTEVYIVKHTGCGMLTFKSPDLHAIVHEKLGADVSHIDYLEFSDLEQAVLDDVELVKTSKYVLPDTPVRGGVYDVETGTIKWLN